MTVGYAAFNTNLNITAKGNVLEKGIKPIELKNNLVTSGDGLYKDTTEEGKYIYRGTNPNNYITFNGETWRIISLEKDGTLKIIRSESIGNMIFDPGYTSSISEVTNSNSVTGTRYTNTKTDYCYQYSGTESNYYGCNVWGSKSTMLNSSGANITKMLKESGSSTTYDLPTDESYLNIYLNGGTYKGKMINGWYNSLNQEAKSVVDNHLWNVGPITYQSGQTLAMDLQQESAYKWKGKVGLANTTDFIKTNSNKESCGTLHTIVGSSSNYATCKTTNWLISGNYKWTMSPYFTSHPISVWRTNASGYLVGEYATATVGVQPVIYLKSDITLKGEGTELTPYTIVS